MMQPGHHSRQPPQGEGQHPTGEGDNERPRRRVDSEAPVGPFSPRPWAAVLCPLIPKMKNKILWGRCEGKAQDNLNPAPVQDIKYLWNYIKPRADIEAGLGSQCQETLASLWGKNIIRSAG